MLPSTFGGRIEARALLVRCPFCGAKSGDACRTKSSGLPAPTHGPRWLRAKKQLLKEGDGPDARHLHSV